MEDSQLSQSLHLILIWHSARFKTWGAFAPQKGELYMNIKECIRKILDSYKRMIELEKKEREIRKAKATQAALERQHAQMKQAINLLYLQYDSQLRFLLTQALNALSVSTRVSSTDIDYLSVINRYDGNVWSAHINISDTDSYNPSKLNYIKKCLQEIVDNINKEAIKSFNDYLYKDAIEYRDMVIEAECTNTPIHKNDSVFKKLYTDFYNCDSYKLFGIKLVDITANASTLTILYSVDTSRYDYYHAQNYVFLINTILRSI